MQTLRRQIDGSAQPLFKEREYLALREMINRKEKDLLDLRDAIDAKDRQLLDQKDRYRELERARRDLEEKVLQLEKTFMASEERSTALAHDKDRAIDRERALKSNLDDLQIELHRSPRGSGDPEQEASADRGVARRSGTVQSPARDAGRPRSRSVTRAS